MIDARCQVFPVFWLTRAIEFKMSLVTKLSLQRGPTLLMFVGHWKAISDIARGALCSVEGLCPIFLFQLLVDGDGLRCTCFLPLH